MAHYTRKGRSHTKISPHLSQEQALIAVTRVILQHAYLDDLIPQLTSTVKQVMQVDNVAILRLDPTGQELLMDIVHGPEEAVADQVRVPVGQGVAGRIVSSRQPLVIPNLSQTEVVNSFLSEHLHSLLGVPLQVADHVLGVIHVSTIHQRRFTNNEIHLLSLVADRIAIAIDRVTIAEQARQAQALAEERAAQLEAIFASMTDGVFVLDVDGRLIQYNAAGARLLHLTDPADYSSRPIEERLRLTTITNENGDPLPQDDLPFARILHGEILSGSHTQDIQLSLQDGSTAIVSVSGAPVHDITGRVTAAVSICRDVTERRNLEHQKQTMLDTMLAMAGMVVHGVGTAEDVAHQLADLVCHILGCQRMGISIVEAESGHLIPFTVAGLSYKQEQQWWTEQRSRSTSLSDVPDQEFVTAMHSGQVKIYDFTRPPYNTAPNPYGIQTMLIAPLLVNEQIIGIFAYDYGEEHHLFSQAEQQLAIAVAHLVGMVIERDHLIQERTAAQAQALALKETTDRMQTFLGVTSHELRSPLTSIKASGQLAHREIRKVIEDDLPETVANRMNRAIELLELVDKQTDQMNRFISDLLDNARIQAGKLELHPTTKDINELVREVVAIQQINWPDRVIDAETPENAIIVHCDPDRINQVIANLITNAFRYSPSDRPVHVKVQPEKNQVRVAVIDQGQGLTAGQQIRLFEAFVKAEGVQQLGGTSIGLGLGLFISKTIISQHGGQIGVESQEGMGSTFWFTLPREDAESE
jgi:signal transduction histidine kinase/PAS domain-containing protein